MKTAEVTEIRFEELFGNEKSEKCDVLVFAIRTVE